LRHSAPTSFEFPSAKLGKTDSLPLGLGAKPGAIIPWLFEVLLIRGKEAQPGSPVVGATELQTSIPGDADIPEVILKRPL
jgi:hypothetical protein